MAAPRRRPGRDPRIPLSYKPFHTLAFDPGGTTGWASAEYRDTINPLTAFNQIKVESGQLGAGHVHHLELWEFLLRNFTPSFTNIVCESFEFRQHLGTEEDEDGRMVAKTKRKVELISRDYIGIITLFCEMHDVPLTMNTASTGKTFVTPEKLEILGLWTPGQTHANDAKRHLIRYLTINKRMNFIMRLWLDA